MQVTRGSERIWLVVALAALGGLMVFIPPQILDQYERISKFGSIWVTVYFSIVGLGIAIFLTLGGMLVWKLWSATRQKRVRQQSRSRSPSELSRQEQQSQIEENLADAQQLQQEPGLEPNQRTELQKLSSRLDQKRQAKSIEIVAFGTISSGKSSLLNALLGQDRFQTDPRGGTTTQRIETSWQEDDRLILVDTPGLGEVAGSERGSLAASSAKDADILLMVVDGPLRESEFALLKQLAAMEKRLILCLNKADWFDDDAVTLLRKQLTAQLGEIIRPEDLVTVRSQASHRTRTRVLANGTEEEEQIELPPDISQLAARLMQIVQSDGESLVIANVLLQSRGLVEEARKQAQAAIDRQAWDVVQKYTWGSAGAAALSPLPVVDLIAGTAIITKMVLDLAKVYRQKVDSDLAMTLLGQLGKNLVANLGVAAAAPAIASGMAGLLKTIPGVGTLAGGTLQGVVQALVTRWIGGVFIEYFKAGMQQPEGGLSGLARKEWDRITAPAQLYQFVREAREHLSGKANSRQN